MINDKRPYIELGNLIKDAIKYLTDDFEKLTLKIEGIINPETFKSSWERYISIKVKEIVNLLNDYLKWMRDKYTKEDIKKLEVMLKSKDEWSVGELINQSFNLIRNFNYKVMKEPWEDIDTYNETAYKKIYSIFDFIEDSDVF